MKNFRLLKKENNTKDRQRASCSHHASSRKGIKKSASLLTLFTVLCLMLNFRDVIHAQEKEFHECSVTAVRSSTEIQQIPAGYTQNITASYQNKDGTVFYFCFTLDMDAWVFLSGNYSMCSHDGAGTHIDIYNDAAMSSKAGSYGWGYWQHDHEFTGFLKTGTYYAQAVTKQANYQGDFTGNVNITAAAIPVATLFDFNVKVSSDWKNAEVFLADALGPYTKNVQYRKGSIGIENVYGRKYWKRRLMDDYYSSEPEESSLLFVDNGKYSFQVSANGYYTVMAEDMSGSRYSAIVKVFGIDNKKPSVSGVKNGKIYKKAVNIKFSDEKSGIKTAKLNGKKISSGKKISAVGAYKLEVYDKAGNKTIVRFSIKK